MKYEASSWQLVLGIENITFVKQSDLSIIHRLNFILPVKLYTSHFILS